MQNNFNSFVSLLAFLLYRSDDAGMEVRRLINDRNDGSVLKTTVETPSNLCEGRKLSNASVNSYELCSPIIVSVEHAGFDNFALFVQLPLTAASPRARLALGIGGRDSFDPDKGRLNLSTYTMTNVSVRARSAL